MQLHMIVIPVIQQVRSQFGRAAALGSDDNHGFLLIQAEGFHEGFADMANIGAGVQKRRFNFRCQDQQAIGRQPAG